MKITCLLIVVKKGKHAGSIGRGILTKNNGVLYWRIDKWITTLRKSSNRERFVHAQKLAEETGEPILLSKGVIMHKTQFHHTHQKLEYRSAHFTGGLTHLIGD